MATHPKPNPATVEALLDTTWRLGSADAARTEALDRRASTAATLASLIATLTATPGLRFVGETQSWLALTLFVGSLGTVASLACAVRALWPRQYLTLATSYIHRFPTWGEVLKPPEQVRGETMRTLVEAIARERAVGDEKLLWLRRSFALLLVGLSLVAVEGATLALDEVYG